MTARESLAAIRQLGGNLSLANGKVRVETPAGALTTELRQALQVHKPELLALLGTEQRQTEVAGAISAAYDRLNQYAPWTPPEACAHQDLGAAVDAAGRSYIQGSGDLATLETAIQRWENALSAGRRPSAVGCPCRSVTIREELDGSRVCGRCGRLLNPAPMRATDDELPWGGVQ
jgi:hypothetical protein